MAVQLPLFFAYGIADDIVVEILALVGPCGARAFLHTSQANHATYLRLMHMAARREKWVLQCESDAESLRALQLEGETHVDYKIYRLCVQKLVGAHLPIVGGFSGLKEIHLKRDFDERLTPPDWQQGLAEAMGAFPAGLEALECWYLHLSAMPALPPALLRLVWVEAKGNGRQPRTFTGPLPTTLLHLTCQLHSALTTPDVLPPMLVHLDLKYTRPMRPQETPGLSAALRHRLPALPATLQYFSCEQSKLTQLPALPAGLTHLNCSHISPSILPADTVLPGTLLVLNCSSSKQAALPALPRGLLDLNCAINLLTALPDQLPPGLTDLETCGNELTSVPALPQSLRRLSIGFNPISFLPAVPPSLERLHCQYALLRVLPDLPDTLRILNCEEQQLEGGMDRLPALPASLQSLRCDGNGLTTRSF